MKLFFEADGGTVDPFEIEVENSDTVLQVKEKIHNSQGIPISDQTLFFEGKILHDDVTVEASGVEDQSRIRLKLPEKNEEDTAYDDGDDGEDITALPKKKVKTEAAGSSSNTIPIQISSESVVTVEIPPPPPPPPQRMTLLLTLPGSDEFRASNIHREDTILQLKEIIHEKDGTPVDLIVIKDDEGNELSDHRTLTDCGIMPDSPLKVEYQPPSSSASSSSSDHESQS